MGRLSWLLTGMILGATLWAGIERMFPRPSPPPVKEPALQVRPIVNPNDPLGIVRALSVARAGDTVEVPPGQYLGPIQLKEGVSLICRAPGQAVVRSPDSGIAVIARGIRSGRVAGLRIAGDEALPLRTGILVSGAAVELDDIEISGARDAAIWIDGSSQAVLRANYIHGNSGFGVVIQDASAPRLVGNTITDNGRSPGVEIRAPARPALENNVITHNGTARPSRKIR